jgi:hypothetical protein
MKKVYLVFTVIDSKTVDDVEVFTNKEDAIERIDYYSDAQVNLEKGVSEISDKYSDEFVPQELHQMFWPVGKILYGIRVKGYLVKGFYKAKISYTTDRFVVEKEVN